MQFLCVNVTGVTYLFRRAGRQITVAPAFPRYDKDMARGWESKSVEEQVEQQRSSEPSGKAKNGNAVGAATTARTLERQALELQRDRILDERTSSPIRRKALEAALAEIEAKLNRL